MLISTKNYFAVLFQLFICRVQTKQKRTQKQVQNAPTFTRYGTTRLFTFGFHILADNPEFKIK